MHNSGETCERSEEYPDNSSSWWVGHLAQIIPEPTLKAKDLQAIALNYGGNNSESSKNVDPLSSCGKTPQDAAILKETTNYLPLEPFCGALSRAGTVVSGNHYKLVSWERPMSASAASLLHTPMTCSSDSKRYRRPGQDKLERQLRKELDFLPGMVSHVNVREWMLGLPLDSTLLRPVVGGVPIPLMVPPPLAVDPCPTEAIASQHWGTPVPPSKPPSAGSTLTPSPDVLSLRPTANDIGRYVYCDELEQIGVIQSVGVTRKTPAHPARRTAQVLISGEAKTIEIQELELLPLDKELAFLQSELQEIQQQIDTATIAKDSLSKKSDEYRLLDKHYKSEWKRLQDCIKRAEKLASSQGMELAMPGELSGESWLYRFEFQKHTSLGETTMVAAIQLSDFDHIDFSGFPVDNPRTTDSVRQNIALAARASILGIASKADAIALLDRFTKEQLRWVRKNVLTDEENINYTNIVKQRKAETSTEIPASVESFLERNTEPEPEAVEVAKKEEVVESADLAVETEKIETAIAPIEPTAPLELAVETEETLPLLAVTPVEVAGVSDQDECDRIVQRIHELDRSHFLAIAKELLRLQEVWKPTPSFARFDEYCEAKLGKRYGKSQRNAYLAAAKLPAAIGGRLESVKQSEAVSRLLNVGVDEEKIVEVIEEAKTSGKFSKAGIKELAVEKGYLPKPEPKPTAKAETAIKEQAKAVGLSGKESQQLPSIPGNSDVPPEELPASLFECLTFLEATDYIKANPEVAIAEFVAASWEARFDLRSLTQQSIDTLLLGCADEKRVIPVRGLLEADKTAKIQWLESEMLRLQRENDELRQKLNSKSKHKQKDEKTTIEWYTPSRYVDMVRDVFGGQINTDPASNDFAQSWIKAETYFTKETDGLANSDKWHGFVYCNPPYGNEPKKWLAEAIRLYESGQIKGAIFLLNRSDGMWYRQIKKQLAAVCEVHSRICFIGENGDASDRPMYANDFLCIGGELVERFAEVFSGIGDVTVIQSGEQLAA